MIKYKPLKTYRHGQWVDSGEWGIEISGADALSEGIEEGEEVEVRRKNGLVKRETIGKILSRKDGCIICTIDRQVAYRRNYSEIDYREGRCRDTFTLY
jgi:hypothetical protein